MVGFLPEKTQDILEKYPFFKSFLAKKITKEQFVQDLEAFRPDLIKNGVTKDEIDVLENWALGGHPSEGNIKFINNEYMQRKAGWKIHLNVQIRNHSYVYEWLRANCPYSCKYAKHGG